MPQTQSQSPCDHTPQVAFAGGISPASHHSAEQRSCRALTAPTVTSRSTCVGGDVTTGRPALQTGAGGLLICQHGGWTDAAGAAAALPGTGAGDGPVLPPDAQGGAAKGETGLHPVKRGCSTQARGRVT